MSHDETLRAAIAGEGDALEALVRAYHDRVYRFGLRACRDRFDADDAVQEAFAKLALRPDVQRDAGALSWLMSVVRNACLRLLRPFARARARLGERVDDVDGVASETITPDAAMERFELVQRVHRAIATLAPTYREVLILRDLEGCSGDEVAATLGISEAAMKSRLHRARSLVREALLEDAR
ncbi:RNA polymerase sigma factor [Sandaracinus amylolyticus]|uniref:RNA polymerase sigma-54 factor RpoN n=1 Tax=Sandaracinus amylolyticus TaxID=927083 RepID=A0A0F6W1Y7_9BACT|nr:sigma-70 family RNA polymerase sigma factor [Sandaracinus amylolyticus]AKF05208.1 RNA polymerase sigma-54 factor RpoN [Sandaracinus amylolyticus]